MENVALNTIFYIMIFIFPGILFRKFYFGGDFNKQFQQGNLMERFLWTVFFSVIIISLCVLSFIYLENHTNFKIANYLTYDTIKDLFESLSNNKLPEETDKNSKIYLNFLYLILLIYLISAVFGYFSYKIIRILNLDVHVQFLRYKNYWHYLSRSKKINGNQYSNNKYLYTQADVLVQTNEKNELYGGYLHNFYTDASTNKLECIVLRDAYKFITKDVNDCEDIEQEIKDGKSDYEVYKKYKEKTVFKKNIKGDILTLFNENIININLTYVELVKSNLERISNIKNVIVFTFYLILALTIIIPWIIDHDLVFTIKRKIIISFLFFCYLTFIKNYLFEVFKIKNKNNGIKNFFLGFIFFLIPLLWFFKIMTAWKVLGLLVLYFLILTGFINNNKTKST
ncbi:hypothetical protein [Flavobacterium celericrescens]|uniref:Permease n=1 Tax=Flavobacterium celericrescens TaxID=2709780 RepID=A0ABX0I7Z7_9FLAO|nr:hypothetical protein [Flavobacterium celericrescens]NHM03285.1 hypothetical protein [Flavobacterium celericrescens]